MAQSVISAKSGMIHYVEGRVLLDGKPVDIKFAHFPEIKEGVELRTEDGRAEILLTPGAFLRLGENSAVRMVSAKLTDARLEFLSGSAVIEADADLTEADDLVTILYKGSVVRLRKAGIYRFDSEPAQLRVYDGQAEVETGANVLVVKGGKMAALPHAVAAEKFNAKNGDALNRWSERRAQYVSMANISAAKYVRDSGKSWKRNDWFYNTHFGMMTFIPGSGVYRSPYGYSFYCPRTVYRIYQPPVIMAPMQSAGGFGGRSAESYRTVPQTSSGYSGVVASTPAPSTRTEAPAASGGGAVSRESGRSGSGR